MATQLVVSPKSKEFPHFFFPDFFLTNPAPWFWHENWEYVTLDEANVFFEHEISPSSLQWQCPYKALFYNEFINLKELFAQGKLRKAVPFVFDRSSSKMTAQQINHSLQSVIEYCQTNNAHLYGFWDETQGILGATPEYCFN